MSISSYLAKQQYYFIYYRIGTLSTAQIFPAKIEEKVSVLGQRRIGISQQALCFDLVLAENADCLGDHVSYRVRYLKRSLDILLVSSMHLCRRSF